MQTDIHVEKQKQIDNLFTNIQAITNLLKKIDATEYKSEIIVSYIQEFLKQVQIIQSSNRTSIHLNLLNDISTNKEYQEILLSFYLEIFKVTYNNTNVTNNIQSLLNLYVQLKDVFYQKLVQLSNISQLPLLPFLDYLLLQKDENEDLFNLYVKLFNRNNISDEQIENIKIKLDGYIVQLISKQNEKVENLIDKLMLETKTKELLTDIIILKDTQDIIKLPKNIKKVAYSNLCANNKIFDVENNIEAIQDILETSNEYNNCILNIITRKLAKPQEVGEALSIIKKMQNMSDEIKKEILNGLNKQKKHETFSDEVKNAIKELT